MGDNVSFEAVKVKFDVVGCVSIVALVLLAHRMPKSDTCHGQTGNICQP